MFEMGTLPGLFFCCFHIGNETLPRSEQARLLILQHCCADSALQAMPLAFVLQPEPAHILLIALKLDTRSCQP